MTSTDFSSIDGLDCGLSEGRTDGRPRCQHGQQAQPRQQDRQGEKEREKKEANAGEDDNAEDANNNGSWRQKSHTETRLLVCTTRPIDRSITSLLQTQDRSRYRSDHHHPHHPHRLHFHHQQQQHWFSDKKRWYSVAFNSKPESRKQRPIDRPTLSAISAGT